MKKLSAIVALILAHGVVAHGEDKKELPKTEGKLEALDPAKGHFEYDFEKQVWVGYDGVVITYQDSILTADKVIYNELTGEAEAEGNVRIQREDHIFSGDKLKYNFKTREILGGRFRTGQPPFFAAGESLYIDEKSQKYVGNNVYITTDDIPGPSQRLRARKMTMVPGEYFEARHATFEVGGVPVFYLPYYRRQLGANVNNFNVIPGYRSRYGPYLLGTYNWYWNEKLDGATHVDYRLKRGFGFGQDFTYNLEDYGKGEFKYYFLDDHRPGRDHIGDDINDERQRVYFTHHVDFTEDLMAKAVIRYQTDPYIVRDYFESEYKKNVQPSSFVEVNQLWKNWSLDVLFQPRLNDFYDTVERLPDLRLTGFRQQLGESPFYYESESSLGYYTHQFAYNLIDDFEAFRGDTYHQIVMPKTFFGWLNVIPRVGGRWTYYGETNGDTMSQDHQSRSVFNTGAEVNFKASRLYANARSKIFDINQLRHIIQPSINYVFVPEPTRRPPHLPQFDSELPSLRLLPIEYPDYNSIDSVDAQNVIRFSLWNRLQTKREKGIEYFAKWGLYTDWRLDPRREQTTMSDFYSDLELRPKSWAQLRSILRYSFDEDSFKEVYNRVTLQPYSNWSVSLGQRYLMDDPMFGRGQNIYATSFYYRLNENWAFRTSHHFEARDGTLEEQYYTIYRDMRSWTGALTLRMRDHRRESDDITIAFTFSIKAFPRFGLEDDVDRPALLLGY